MKPYIDEGAFREHASALVEFIFVMGEDEVDSAAVEIEVIPEEVRAHGDTFRVPPWTPESPRAIPSWLF